MQRLRGSITSFTEVGGPCGQGLEVQVIFLSCLSAFIVPWMGNQPLETAKVVLGFAEEGGEGLSLGPEESVFNNAGDRAFRRRIPMPSMAMLTADAGLA